MKTTTKGATQGRAGPDDQAQPHEPGVWVDVESSNLSAVSWGGEGDGSTGSLDVEFKSGAIWRYSEVSRERFDALMKADSKGRYFAREIKPKHKARQVDASEAGHRQPREGRGL